MQDEEKERPHARGDEWRYGFRFWSGRLHWLDNGDRDHLFD